MARYAVLLRGINVGGHNKLKMADLRQAFASWGFQNVKTVLASGNVVFETADATPAKLATTIEQRLLETFGMVISVIVRTQEQVKDLVDADPFQEIEVTSQTRFYVTFLPKKPESSLKIPYESPGGEFKILHASSSEVFSVLTLTRESRTTNAMDVLEKEFGKNITTRNWNTITRLASM